MAFMKRMTIIVLLVLTLNTSVLSYAQTPELADADKLFNFSEMREPALFFPPSQTQQINAAGADWFYRYFTGTDSYIAININGVSPYSGGSVYVVGGQFGADPLYVDTLDNLLVAIDNTEPQPLPVENEIFNQGNGNCVARKFAAKNDTARIRTTDFSSTVPTISERSEFYEELTPTKTITVIEEEILMNGVSAATSKRVTTNFNSQNGMLFNSSIEAIITTSTAGSFPVSQTSNTTYAPSLFVGPSDLLCEGQMWTVAAVEETVVEDPGSSESESVTIQTPSAVGMVNSTNETVSLRGGTYNTVKVTLTTVNSKSIIWTDLVTGVIVLSESYEGGSDNPIRREELLTIDLPF